MSPDMNFDANIAQAVTAQDLMDWQELKKQKAAIEAKERALRERIVKYFFPAPVEGVNKFDLGEGYTLKLTYKIDRKIDTAMLTNLAPSLRERGILIETLVEAKPQLKTAEYRKLQGEALQIFNQCLTSKPGSPTVEIVAPKTV